MKPDNFLLMVPEEYESTDWRKINTSKMTIKLADFGCGHTFQGMLSREKPVTVIGNDAYLAPEVWKGWSKGMEKVDYSRKSDIWSLAIIAYKCSTGKTPGNV